MTSRRATRPGCWGARSRRVGGAARGAVRTACRGRSRVRCRRRTRRRQAAAPNRESRPSWGGSNYQCMCIPDAPIHAARNACAPPWPRGRVHRRGSRPSKAAPSPWCHGPHTGGTPKSAHQTRKGGGRRPGRCVTGELTSDASHSRCHEILFRQGPGAHTCLRRQTTEAVALTSAFSLPGRPRPALFAELALRMGKLLKG